jgi:hypothetical protein
MLLAACSGNAAPGNDRNADLDPEAPPPPIVSAAAAVREADIQAMQIATMTNEEAEHALGAPGACSFTLTRAGDPVISLSAETGGQGVIKLNEQLVVLTAAEMRSQNVRGFASAPVRLSISPLGGGDDADARVWIGADNLRGYRGYYLCEG